MGFFIVIMGRERVFPRKNDVMLDNWLESQNRRPLVLRGARQIGKSTAIRRLAARKHRQLVEVDLERHKRLESAFATLDIEVILQELQIVTKKRISPDSIVFLDEAQGTPNSLAALRYFFENRPDIPVVAAGSLLEFALAETSFSMPVGRIDFARMYPVTFSEYLDAIGAALEKEVLEGFLAHKSSSIPPSAHMALMKLYSEYVLIGGMPAAVADTLGHTDVVTKLNAAALVHERLVEAFRDDFAKYRKRISVDLLRSIFDSLPAVAGNTKVKYVSLAPNERTESIKRGLSAILLAGIAKKITHTPARGVPISSGADDEVFKILPLDVGMSSSQALGTVRSAGLPQSLFAKWEDGNQIERRWMGQLAECAIGQALLAQNESNDRLHYWLREGKSTNAEVDYVVQSQMQIVPIEVKSGSSGTLKSLHQFVAERKLAHAMRFDLNPPTVQNLKVQALVAGGKAMPVSYQLHSLPVYLSDYVYKYIQSRFD
jgi:predicted AAA+ superfamily ATPase